MRFIFNTLALVAVAALGAAHPIQPQSSLTPRAFEHMFQTQRHQAQRPQSNLTSLALDDMFRTHVDSEGNTVYKFAYNDFSSPSRVHALSKRIYYDPNDVYEEGTCTEYNEYECQFSPAFRRHVKCLDDCQKWLDKFWCPVYGTGVSWSLPFYCVRMKNGKTCPRTCKIGLDRFAPKVLGAVATYQHNHQWPLEQVDQIQHWFWNLWLFTVPFLL